MKTALLVILLVAAGCSKQIVPDPPSPGMPGGPDVIHIGDNGLTPALPSPVTKLTLVRAFEGYEVDGSSEGTRFAVRHAGATIVVVDLTSDGGYLAQARHASVVGPNGRHVGDAFENIARLPELQCLRGNGRWTELVRCTSAVATNIVYSLKVPVDVTPDCVADCAIEPVSSLTGQLVKSIDYQ